MNYAGFEDHSISVGGNVRLLHYDPIDGPTPAATLDTTSYDEFSVGAFVIDRWDLTSRLALETQARLDRFSAADEALDWSGRLTALYALDANADHVARIGVARAFRFPSTTLRRYGAANVPAPSPPFPPGTPVIGVTPNPDLGNEQLVSFEAGYAGTLTPNLTLRVDGYAQRYRELVSYESFNRFPGLVDVQPRNVVDADAHGVEAQIGWRSGGLELTGWYAWNHFEADEENDLRGYKPAEHKVGLTARVDLPADLVFSANYRYTGTTPGDNPDVAARAAGIDPHHLLDLNLALPIELGERGEGELMVGVYDVLDEGDLIATSSAEFDLFSQPHPSPGQTFFLRFRAEF